MTDDTQHGASGNGPTQRPDFEFSLRLRRPGILEAIEKTRVRLDNCDPILRPRLESNLKNLNKALDLVDRATRMIADGSAEDPEFVVAKTIRDMSALWE